jgi:predicted ArsR family transcriptional regulator
MGASGTRERIIRLLLLRERTVEDLSGDLGITRNAVRSQLALLEREGAVEVRGAVKGTRRPAALYGARVGAETHFSRAYPLALSGLVRVLARRLPGAEMERVMRDLGRQMASGEPPTAGDARERVRAAAALMAKLGSVAEAAESHGKITLRGDSCPIAEAVTADERSCGAMAGMLEALTGLPVSEKCRHRPRPACRFEIALPRRG